MVKKDMRRLPNALAWPSAWSTNALAQTAAQIYIDDLLNEFPDRVVTTPIPFVNSVAALLATSLDSPSTAVRSAARKVFRGIAACRQESPSMRAEQVHVSGTDGARERGELRDSEAAIA